MTIKLAPWRLPGQTISIFSPLRFGGDIFPSQFNCYAGWWCYCFILTAIWHFSDYFPKNSFCRLHEIHISIVEWYSRDEAEMFNPVDNTFMFLLYNSNGLFTALCIKVVYQQVKLTTLLMFRNTAMVHRNCLTDCWIMTPILVAWIW